MKCYSDDVITHFTTMWKEIADKMNEDRDNTNVESIFLNIRRLQYF